MVLGSVSDYLANMQKSIREPKVFDAVVYGDTCAAYGAALDFRNAGQSVLLVSRHTGLVREASWSFLQSAQLGTSESWGGFRRLLERRNAWQHGRIDGACAEVVAAEYGLQQGIEFLFYAVPINAEEDDGLVSRIGFWTKQGERWISARRWLDASGRGELVGVLDGSSDFPEVVSCESALFFRHPEAVAPSVQEWKSPVARITHAEYGPSIWSNESVVRFHGAPGRVPQRTVDMLAFVRANADLNRAVVSHGSFVPLEFRAAEPRAPANLPGNIGVVSFSPTDVGSMIDAGVEAAARVRVSPASSARPGAPVVTGSACSEACDVGVIGLGTGGVLAALAAAREGASVSAVELLPVLGGVGTAGGIHLYYFGVEGGLQREIDQRISAVMPLFGSRKNIAGFHPMAKSLIVESMLAEAGVRVFSESMLGPVNLESDQRISSVTAFSPFGPIGLRAGAWVDSSGDGDLAVGAGVSFERSARSDGQASAYSQGSGRFRWRDGELFLRILNFDAGFVDATDSWDLTRARLRGLEHYREDQFTCEEHPTYIAPLIGVRQSRHIETLYQVTLADLAVRSRFADAVGYTACHFDSHAIDFEFESEEAAFWIWGCRNWRLRTGCAIPYRSLIPQGVTNLLIGCRAVGATPDAHQSFRMQRDMQRVGEVAGISAAFAARFDCRTSDVPYEWLRKKLEESGALKSGENSESGFGYHVEGNAFVAPTESVTDLVQKTREGFGLHMYLLTLVGEAAIPLVRPLLDDPEASWRASLVLAMLGDEAAEPRLLEAIRSREIGFASDDPRHPSRCPRLAPNWIVALVFLRRCATKNTLGALDQLAADGGLVHNARTATALLCAELAKRLGECRDNASQVSQLLDKLMATPAPNAIGRPQRTIVESDAIVDDSGIWYPEVIEDFRWQLHFAVGKARLAWGVGIDSEYLSFLSDSRLPVRRAFKTIGACASVAGPAEVVLG